MTAAGDKRPVAVVVRTRPTPNFAQDNIKIDSAVNTITVHLDKASHGFINNQKEEWPFQVNSILHNSSQEQVYDECGRGLVEAALEGYNGTIIAYGQTGAGKTFSITGTTENYRHRGIIPRAVAQLFREIQTKPNVAVVVRVSYLEVYMETVEDLLAGDDEAAANVHIVDDKNGVQIRGLNRHICNSEEEALNYLFEGDTRRTMGRHTLNRNSTRSHCIFTIYLEMRSRVESAEKVTQAKLNFVDLAGSERVKKTGSDGKTLEEAKYINKSLSFLEQVVTAIGDRRSHVPYRQTKLTNCLKDSIGGNCRTILLANIWPEVSQLEETISTLRFAQRMMRVTNEPVVNVVDDPVARNRRLEHEIQDLRDELAMHDALANRAHVAYAPFTEQQRYELNKRVRAYLRGETDDLEVLNLRQVKETFQQFRIIVSNMESYVRDQVRKEYDGATLPGGEVKGTINTRGFLEDNAVGELDLQGFSLGEAPATAKPLNSDALRKKPSAKVPRHKHKRPKGSAKGSKKEPIRTPSQAALEKAAEEAKGAAASKAKRSGKEKEAAAPKVLTPKEKTAASAKAPPAAADSKGGDKGGDKKGVAAAAAAALAADKKGDDKEKKGKRKKKGSKDKAGLDVDDAGDPAVWSSRGSSGMPKSGTSTPDENLAEDGHELESPTGEPVVYAPAVKPSTEEGFEEFKRGPGAEINRTLILNKGILKEKKDELRDLSLRINTDKEEIDRLRLLMDKARQTRMNAPGYRPEDADVVDEEEYDFMLQSRGRKESYKAARTKFDETKSAVAYMNNLVARCREKLLSDFQTWYQEQFGHLEDAPRGSSFAVLAEREREVEVEQDVLDEGEKWDLMQTERIAKEDPEAVAYYQARKTIQRRKAGSLKRSGGGR